MKKIILVTILCLFSFCKPEETKPDYRVALPAQYSDFPYAVSLQNAHALNQIEGHVCGGGLITNRHVLTAAFCMHSFQDSSVGAYVLHDTRNFNVFAGATLLSNTSTDRLRGIERFVPHPQYIGMPSNVNDIGIIILNQVFPENIGIRPIPLSSMRPAENANCRLAGWGASFYGQQVPVQMLYYEKYVFNQDTCRNLYAFQHNSPNILSNMICASSKNSRNQLCHGNNGNLLTCDGDLTGVLSWYHCHETPLPEVYIATANYTAWIQGVIGGGASTSSPTVVVMILAVVINVLKS